MKRIFLFLITNLAIMLVLSVVLSVLGLDRFLTANGINYTVLLGFSLVVGFGGSFLSLLISKPMAKWSTGARVIDGSEGTTEYWLVQTVNNFADKAGIGRPQVAVYEGEPNAFATGAFIEIHEVEDLIDIARAFGSRKLPAGNRAAIITVSGGAGVLFADCCEQSGLALSTLTPGSDVALREFLPEYATLDNPFDLTAQVLNDALKRKCLQWNGC